MKNANTKISLPILSGSLTTATAKCGNKSCRCQKDKKYWHGPYYRWSGMLDGKRTTVTLSGDQVEMCRTAIENYKKLKEIEENLIKGSMQMIKNLPSD